MHTYAAITIANFRTFRLEQAKTFLPPLLCLHGQLLYAKRTSKISILTLMSQILMRRFIVLARFLTGSTLNYEGMHLQE